MSDGNLDWVSMEMGDLGASIYNDHPLDSSTHKLKQNAIVKSLLEGNRANLQALSLSKGGLLTSSLRLRVWLALLRVEEPIYDSVMFDSTMVNSALFTPKGHFPESPGGLAAGPKVASTEKPHPDENQVRLDVERSFVHFPELPLPAELAAMREDLSRLITLILRSNRFLHYYQGYHDVASIVYLVFREADDADLTQTYAVLECLTLTHLRDFMVRDIQPSIDQLMLLPALVSQVDATFGSAIGLAPPFYALSSVLTMFSHDLHRFEDVCLIMDFIVAIGEASSSIYIFAAALLYHRSELSQATMDTDTLHSRLSKLFEGLETADLFSILLHAHHLSIQQPLTLLTLYQTGISRYSVLKLKSVFESDSDDERTVGDLSESSEAEPLGSSLSSSVASLETVFAGAGARSPYSRWKDRIETMMEKLDKEAEVQRHQREESQHQREALQRELCRDDHRKRARAQRLRRWSLFFRASLAMGLLSVILHHHQAMVLQSVSLLLRPLSSLGVASLGFAERALALAGRLWRSVGLSTGNHFHI